MVLERCAQNAVFTLFWRSILRYLFTFSPLFALFFLDFGLLLRSKFCKFLAARDTLLSSLEIAMKQWSSALIIALKQWSSALEIAPLLLLPTLKITLFSTAKFTLLSPEKWALFCPQNQNLFCYENHTLFCYENYAFFCANLNQDFTCIKLGKKLNA